MQGRVALQQARTINAEDLVSFAHQERELNRGKGASIFLLSQSPYVATSRSFWIRRAITRQNSVGTYETFGGSMRGLAEHGSRWTQSKERSKGEAAREF